MKGEQGEAMFLRRERQVPVSHVVLVPDLEPLRRESPLPESEEVVSKAKRMWSWVVDGKLINESTVHARKSQAHAAMRRDVRSFVMKWPRTARKQNDLCAKLGYRVIPVYVTTEDGGPER